jgi:putative NIF3 family GTP cyclohydrolase 1 type 2
MDFKAISLFIIALVLSGSVFGQEAPQKEITANQIISMIRGKVTCPWSDNTVDTFKSGNPEDAVTGVAVCMFADMKALRQSVADKCNLIIVHEPTFYSHQDETKSLSGDPVFVDKLKYINDHHLIIWRFHDHIHRTNPDGIYVGVVEKLGWGKNRTDNSLTRFKFDKVKLSDFIHQLKILFPESSFRVIGTPDLIVSHAALSLGAPGSSSHLKLLQEPDMDLLVAGESPEWETYQYVYDAQLQGKNRAVIFLGHTNSEEAGMEYCAKWLKGFLPNSIPIHYIRNGSSFNTY